MKKITSLLLVLGILMMSVSTVFAASFNDLPSDHWAVSYIDTLVADGTINGYEDGSFRPAGTVTRAEFVKMIGNGPTRRDADFADVDKAHWAYEYVMTSGFEPGSEFFEPSKPITRGEVANLLWTRAGSPKGLTAPPVIFTQSNNPDAASWAYTNKIMNGDDYLNLRLGDTLTRAEAATLIVRSRQINSSGEKVNFIDSIDQKIFETAYKAYGLVDKEYSAEAKITNGELAYAAARIISKCVNPNYPGVSATISFEHDYAMAVNMLTRYYAGEENDNAAYADRNATVQDAIMALMFATQRTSRYPFRYDANGATYANATPANDAQAMLLRRAYQNGICLADVNTIDFAKEITLRELACLFIEFDGISGFVTGDVFGVNSRDIDYKLNTVLATYPSNASIYKIIHKDIPNSIYEAPFADAIETPAQSFTVVTNFKSVFDTMFIQWKTFAKSKGATIEITDNPALAVKTSNGYTLRVKLTVVDAGNVSKLSDIIKCSNDSIGAKTLVTGDEFYVDVNTGVKLVDITFPFENIYVNQIIE